MTPVVAVNGWGRVGAKQAALPAIKLQDQTAKAFLFMFCATCV